MVPPYGVSTSLPTRIEIEPDVHNGLAEISCARCEDIRSVSERRLMHRVGGVDGVVLAQVGRTITRFLELGPYGDG